MKKIKLLVVDDEIPQQKILRVCFEKRGFSVLTAGSGEEALALFEKEKPDVVLTDMKMGGMSGMQLLKEIKNKSYRTEVILITAYGDVEVAVEALKSGAADFILKPVDLNNLIQIVNNAAKRITIMDDISEQKKSSADDDDFNLIITNDDDKMSKIIRTAKLAARSDVTILIRGESGTGKELLASAIQRHSKRADKPFVVVNCAALNENLLESELFGHCKGAFTSAISDRMGRFEEADGGTVFLDEIGDIPLGTQVKLLRVLQEGEIQKVGENKVRKIDVRIITATNQNLETMIVNRTFRQDLYYRLNVIPFTLPPLRERVNDIPLLVNCFVKKYSPSAGKEPPSFSEKAMKEFKNYPFHGNIRELQNIIQRTLVMNPGEIIDNIEFPRNPITNSDSDDNSCDKLNYGNGLEDMLENIEAETIQKVLEEEKYNLQNTADKLKMSVRQLRYRISKLGIK
jgi:DNA-binding NtrC family response regulator